MKLPGSTARQFKNFENNLNFRVFVLKVMSGLFLHLGAVARTAILERESNSTFHGK